ncbi:hypothetical protein IHV10_09360 [Fictibacillus sp. 5RED26]|jgi:ribosomal protein L31E|uniref:hypothetical protein n=1 Tax=Fictibacillus sp. 5RED26 TaxID=2745876 RepID=UPI0018CD1390|nr:hypothetical protein [Fictibacillus sp. 5RED26]MBH0156574.1 hypothetical protein [Fictibacillus sp. 5RED26]
MKKKVSIPVILLGILSILVIDVPFFHYPISTPKYLVNVDTKVNYIPFKDTKKYATIKRCGNDCSEVKYHYKKNNRYMSILVTDKLSASSDSIWDKSRKIGKTKFFYEKRKDEQLLAWIDKKNEKEIFITYKGNKKINRNELVKVANSLSIK